MSVRARPRAPTTDENQAMAGKVATKAGAGLLASARAPLGNITNTNQASVRAGNIRKAVSGTTLQPRPTSSTIVVPTQKPASAAPKSVGSKSSDSAESDEPERGTKRPSSVLEALGIAPHTKEAIRTRSTTDADRPSKKARVDVMELEAEVTKPTHINIDEGDSDDPRMVSEYVEEIYAYLREKEVEVQVSPKFLQIQDDINDKMRTVLIDWLIQVHKMFKLLPETLFLTVSICDKYLATKRIERTQLQLVGVTSMLLAAKYEEIYAPEINDVVFVTDSAYTKEQIIDAEEDILATLKFSLCFPSSLHHLRRFSKAAYSDLVIHTLCKYLCEVALMDIKLLKYYPSEIAAGSVYLANAMTNKIPLWSPTLDYYTQYTEAHVRTIALDINEFLKKLQKATVKALIKKYTSPKFQQVAKIPLVSL